MGLTGKGPLDELSESGLWKHYNKSERIIYSGAWHPHLFLLFYIQSYFFISTTASGRYCRCSLLIPHTSYHLWIFVFQKTGADFLIFVSWNVHSFLQRSILFVICPARFLLQVCRDKTLKLKMFSNTIHYTQVHNDQENILKYFKGWIRYLVNFKISSST